jgi:hypothetical protein
LGGPLIITTVLVYIMIFIGGGTSCSSVVKPGPEIVMEIADFDCQQVWEGILRVLKNNKTPLLKVDKKGAIIETGPLLTLPLEGDAFQKIEEQYRIEIKCIEPLVTHITCQIKLRGLTADHKWIPIKKSIGYEKRFLESLKLKNITGPQ